jgi:hypothetical protein
MMDLDEFYPRTCDHDHAFPICAHALGVTDELLLAWSRGLSAVAGWPAVLTDDGLAELAAVCARLEPIPPPEPEGEALMAPQPTATPAKGDCGCGKRAQPQAPLQ